MGASTRAAAWSARRAGYDPVCVDPYLDEDLRAVAEVHSVRNYPAELPAVVSELPATSWFYTGGLENEPEIVERISAIHPPLGNSVESLRLVRDPIWVENFLRSNGFPSLRVRAWTQPPPRDGSWLLKPQKSCGGRGISHWTAESTLPVRSGNACYFQEFRRGLSISALYVAGSRGTELVGCFEQLNGESEFSRIKGFAYRGSVYPVDLPDSAISMLGRLGSNLSRSASLHGIFGIDFIFADGNLWPIEINPRYTASCELLELARRCSLLSWVNPPISGFVSGLNSRGFVGKQIVYSPVELRIERQLAPTPGIEELWELPRVADLPSPGTEIPRGGPICTVYATGADREVVLDRLASSQRRLLKDLGCSPPESF